MNQSFITGFVKRAVENGLTQEQATKLAADKFDFFKPVPTAMASQQQAYKPWTKNMPKPAVEAAYPGTGVFKKQAGNSELKMLSNRKLVGASLVPQTHPAVVDDLKGAQPDVSGDTDQPFSHLLGGTPKA